jgi:hypothetical protein
MRNLVVASLACACAAAGGCDRLAAGAASDPPGTLSGTIRFRDAPIEADGTTRDAAAPAISGGEVIVKLIASAGVDDACADAGANIVDAHYSGGFTISDGRYRAALYPGGVTTPAGCPVTHPDVRGIQNVQILGEIAVTPSSCARFCGADARAEAIDRCHSAGDPRTCDSGLVGGFAAVCEATCATAAGIAGPGTVNAGTMQAYGGDDLETGKLGDVEAAIVLDHLVDAQRRPLAAP